MSFKEYDIPDIGPVTIYKRRGTKNIRLSVRRDGTIRVSIPPWVPYKIGQEFVRSRSEWVNGQRQERQSSLLTSGQAIGKQHRLLFKRDDISAVRSRVRTNLVIVSCPHDVAFDSPEVQRTAKTAAIRALRQEAEELLPARLATMADRHGLRYRLVSVRSLAGRWGSCDSETNIVLNLYLMTLPWELIDYVLLHELTHTIVMKHGPDFWDQMAAFDTETQTNRKAIRLHQPVF